MKISSLRRYKLGSNNIPEIKYLVLSSPHICATKYRICSGKTDTAKNITIHKMTERVKSTIILYLTDDKGVIHLLIDIKCIVIVVYPASPFKNTAHSMGLE